MSVAYQLHSHLRHLKSVIRLLDLRSFKAHK